MAGSNGTKTLDETHTALLGEVGATGLKQSAGVIREELLPKLQGSKGIAVIREMVDNDPIIGAIMFAIEMELRRVEWSTEPFEQNNPQDQERADYVESLRLDMSQTWESFIAEATSMASFGWSYHETVFKYRNGPQLNPGDSSNHNDGLLGWRKLPIRSQDSLDRWVLDDTGGVLGMQQRSSRARSVVVPIEKSLLFRTTSKKNSPEGRSLIRSAYRNWWLKKRIEEYEGIGVERDVAGIPKIGVPASLLDPSANAAQKAALSAFETIGKNLRNDEQAYVMYPLEYDDKGNKRYDIELMSAAGSKQFDTGAIIERHSRQIAMSVLADTIMLGHERVGSNALATTKDEMFQRSLQALVDEMASVLNTHGLRRLFYLNGMPIDRLPRYVPGDVAQVNLSQLGEFIWKLSQAGFPFFPDGKLQAQLRRMAKLDESELDDDESITQRLLDASADLV